MQTILITGGTGLVGKTLTQLLVKKGYRVIILTRDPSSRQNKPQVSYAAWDIKKQSIDADAFIAADAIIHLAGAGVVEKKWTKAYQQEILESRTLSSKLLVDSLHNHVHKVKTIVSASAIGWYGADKVPGHFFTENETADHGFLGQTCLQWEQSIERATAFGVRVCKLRTGIILSNDGGALNEFKKPLRFGVAAILSAGKQVVSWIHIEDLCRMYIYALENNNLSGSYNAVAPMPVTNKELTLSLARNFRGKSYILMHVPGIILKLMMGKSSIEVLKSTTVSCEKIKQTGFTFLYPSIDAAMEQLSKNQSTDQA